ncbi:hypothetical protein L6164_003652 [Bauhinia variegata]|uniref:Uncharacterized protein n=1 Tax=Bauhinia variegata TaxID=167791 RepID=A0ACB9Q3H9_BAUVA|nr:hypothetical protein L6164_003652 [Bauhinia variegata]
MKPKSKKTSLIEETHHKEDAKASSSLFDFTLLSDALNTSEIAIKGQSSSISEDSNPVQSIPKGSFDFTGLSETLNGIEKENQKHVPRWNKRSLCMKQVREFALRRIATNKILASKEKSDLAKITKKFWPTKPRSAIRIRPIQNFGVTNVARDLFIARNKKRVIVMEGGGLFICL